MSRARGQRETTEIYPDIPSLIHYSITTDTGPLPRMESAEKKHTSVRSLIYYSYCDICVKGITLVYRNALPGPIFGSPMMIYLYPSSLLSKPNFRCERAPKQF